MSRKHVRIAAILLVFAIMFTMVPQMAFAVTRGGEQVATNTQKVTLTKITKAEATALANGKTLVEKAASKLPSRDELRKPIGKLPPIQVPPQPKKKM